MSSTDWLTLVLVVVTAFYAWATYRILRANEAVVKAMQDQTEAQLRPFIVIAPSVRTGTTLVHQEVQNTGRSPALNLRLTLDRDFFPHGERRENQSLASLSAFKQRIDSFAPGARLIFNLGVGGTIFSPTMDENLCPKVFRIKAEYTFAGNSYSEDNAVDLRPMLHSSVVADPIATELERLRQSMERMHQQQLQAQRESREA